MCQCRYPTKRYFIKYHPTFPISNTISNHSIYTFILFLNPGMKKSLSPKELLSHEDYMYLIKDNIYDLLLFYIAKRIFLERLHECARKFV